MTLSLLASQLIAAVVLFISTLGCGVLPTWIGKKLLAKSPCKENLPPVTVVDDNNVHVNVVKHHNHQHHHRQHHQHSEQQAHHNHNHNQIPHQQHSPESTRGYLSENQSKLASTAFGRKTLSFLMNLGGGVLLATSFLHMLPEVRESFQKESQSNSSSSKDEEETSDIFLNLPLTELLVCAGFFLIFFAEELVHVLLTKHNGLLTSVHHHNCNDHQHSTPTKYGSTHAKRSIDSEVTHLLSDEELNSTQCDNSSNVIDSMPIFRCIMIIFALSFHSIFDGVAIGLQDTPGHLMQLLFAISTHKLLIAFVVGLQIYTETHSLKNVVYYMLPFSLMSPIGLMVTAWATVALGNFTAAILTAISTGSLLYITFYEILLREKQLGRISGFIQFIAVLTGFCLMALLQALTEH